MTMGKEALMTLVEAVNMALHEAMEKDDRIVVLGEDVGTCGGVFRATQGLLDKFSAVRVIDTPVSEAGIVGAAVGLAMAGMRPVCEIQFDAFCFPAMNQVVMHLARYRWRTKGRLTMPVVVRIPYGGGVRAPELHSESPEAYFCHTPGLRVVVPSSASDAKALLCAAIASDDPVIFLEPKLLYRTALSPRTATEDVSLDRALILRTGGDLMLFGWGAMIPVALEAAERLATLNVSAGVCDVRSLSPLDESTLATAVQSSGRALILQEAPRSCSVASEIAAVLGELALFELRAPIARVTGFDVPYPFPRLEHHQRPNVERVVERALRIMEK